jgi:hypothetical protein
MSAVTGRAEYRFISTSTAISLILSGLYRFSIWGTKLTIDKQVKPQKRRARSENAAPDFALPVAPV